MSAIIDKSTIRQSVVAEITRIFESRGKVPVSRQDVHQATGIKMDILREHMDALLEDGMIYRVERGLYAPVDHTPTRAISITDLPDGRVKIEAGDEMLCLSSEEHRILGARLAGAAQHVNSSALAAHIIRQLRDVES
jgi:hypothetical protein